MDQDDGKFLVADALNQNRLIPHPGVGQLRDLERLDVHRSLLQRDQSHVLVGQHRALGIGHDLFQFAEFLQEPEPAAQLLDVLVRRGLHQLYGLQRQEDEENGA